MKFIASLKLASLRKSALYGNRVGYFKPRMTACNTDYSKNPFSFIPSILSCYLDIEIDPKRSEHSKVRHKSLTDNCTKTSCWKHVSTSCIKQQFFGLVLLIVKTRCDHYCACAATRLRKMIERWMSICLSIQIYLLENCFCVNNCLCFIHFFIFFFVFFFLSKHVYTQGTQA